MAAYDSKIIQKFADDLYVQADGIVGQAVIVAVLLGVAFVGGTYLLAPKHSLLTGVAFVASGVIGWLMYKSAQRRVFELRLKAQEALCQVRIEENTRSQHAARAA